MDKNFIDLIKHFEGCKLIAYLDSVKIPTIGYGATFYQNKTKVKIGDKITQEQANDLLKFHIENFAKGVNKLITSKLTDNQIDALISFAYNVGVGNLKGSTLLRKVNIDPNDPSIQTEFEKWSKAGGKVLSGLVRRRKSEAYLYFNNELKFDF